MKSTKVAAVLSLVLAGSAFAGTLPEPVNGSEVQLGQGLVIESASVYTGVETVEFNGSNLPVVGFEAGLYQGSK